MNVITPAALVNPGVFEYQANGKIERVFDTNGAGELLPIEYKWARSKSGLPRCFSCIR